MAKSKNTVGNSILDQLKDPTDWLAFLVGGAAGALASGHIAGSDMGHVIPTFGLGAVAAKKSLVVACRRPVLKGKCERLVDQLTTLAYADLKELLENYRDTWKLKNVSDDDFSEYLETISKLSTQRQQQAILLRHPDTLKQLPGSKQAVTTRSKNRAKPKAGNSTALDSTDLTVDGNKGNETP